MASPRARFCIYRGFWGELPENQDSQAPQNPRVYESDLPTFTTDVRMNKSMELFASSSGRADNPRLAQGSGGGGPCEAVWWAKHAMVQWRVRGKAFVVGPDIEDQESSGVRTVKSEIGRRMRVVSEEDKETWSWGKELTAHFGNLSPGRRGGSSARQDRITYVMAMVEADVVIGQARSKRLPLDNPSTGPTMIRSSNSAAKSKTCTMPRPVSTFG